MGRAGDVTDLEDRFLEAMRAAERAGHPPTRWLVGDSVAAALPAPVVKRLAFEQAHEARRAYMLQECTRMLGLLVLWDPQLPATAIVGDPPGGEGT